MGYKKPQIFASILAGGQAKRLNGIAKGNLELQSNLTIIQHLITEINTSGIETIIISANVTEPYEKYQLPIVHDNFVNCGPIAGIEASLEILQHDAEAILFLPCDLPNISALEIEALKQTYLNTHNNVFAQTKNGAEPLCAIVKTSSLAALQSLRKHDLKKVSSYWDALNASAVFFANSAAFVNINVYEDYDNL